MRKKIVAGNWKMNKNLAETKTLLLELKTKLTASQTEIIVAPTYTNLGSAVEILEDSSITVAAQNMHQAENGAYTGEISADMLKSIGVETVILGHSERRAYFGETDELLASKVNTALQHDMTIIFCFGEELEDRKKNNHFSVVENQLKKGVFHIAQENWKNVILAYEPVWAIGTGETASPEQAQEMHAFIRKTIANTFSEKVADKVSILYGGSVKPNNAEEIFANPDVDGGLIGGAALDAENFAVIANAI
ncbi:triose-phosphate isomerase [Aquimarina muelleri]|uniref:Triosephosphate isomerase n=1 Tax=Aquimarina muelleri TaxID=279356 RepID=A0A918JXS0_9FLAO|nr:triose-phosphate isomerase [Aquimarina muelleri]MCX2763871.1 triose-phosphate isomerase [Aquimarina muelleri]GGX29169.1 triosephosphate isomerase [Aquimarina muelleri]